MQQRWRPRLLYRPGQHETGFEQMRCNASLGEHWLGINYLENRSESRNFSFTNFLSITKWKYFDSQRSSHNNDVHNLIVKHLYGVSKADQNHIYGFFNTLLLIFYDFGLCVLKKVLNFCLFTFDVFECLFFFLRFKVKTIDARRVDGVSIESLLSHLIQLYQSWSPFQLNPKSGTNLNIKSYSNISVLSGNHFYPNWTKIKNFRC